MRRFPRLGLPLLGAAVAALLLVGCADDGEEIVIEEESEEYAEYNDEALVSDLEAELEEVEVQESRLVMRFRKGARPPRLDRGRVLVGGKRGKFLRKVVSAEERETDQYSELHVETEPAALVDALKRARFKRRMPAAFYPEGEIPSAPWPPDPEAHKVPRGEGTTPGALTIARAPLSDDVGWSSLKDWHFDKVIFAAESENISTELRMIGDLSLEVNLTLEADWDWAGCSLLHLSDCLDAHFDHIRATVGGDAAFDAEVRATLHAAFENMKEKNLATWGYEFAFAIGPVPVWGMLRLAVVGGYDISAEAGGQANWNFSIRTGMEIGADYQHSRAEDNRWRLVWEPYMDIEVGEPRYTIEGEVSCRAFIRPEFELWMYNVFGSGMHIEPWVEMQAAGRAGNEGQNRFCWDLTVGIDAGLDLALGIVWGAFEWTPIDWHPDIPVWTQTIFENCVADDMIVLEDAFPLDSPITSTGCPGNTYSFRSVEPGEHCCEDSDCKPGGSGPASVPHVCKDEVCQAVNRLVPGDGPSL